jgi:drug/metabolite transporter (DMT)-like permease
MLLLNNMITQKISNIKGYAAIMMWSFSALFVAWTPLIPPFLLASITSGIGFLFFCLKWLQKREIPKHLFSQAWPVWVLFFMAVPVYRSLYFLGLKNAPIIEANLLNYLWPILIVALSAILDKKTQSKYFYTGSALCFVGMIFIGMSKSSQDLFIHFEWGHIFALAGALNWALYCVLTRRYPSAPTDMIGIMHAVSFFVLMGLHFVFEPAIHNLELDSWHFIGVIGLGLSVSLGYAFWDDAMSHGEREKVAVMAYFTPLLSTFLLLIITPTSMNLFVSIAAVLIVGGALIARIQSKPS